MRLAFLDVAVDIVSNVRHLCAVLEVVRVSASIVADVLRCPAGEEGVLEARAVCSVEFDDLFVNAVFFQEI